MFTGENLSHLLYAVATGHRDRAKNLVYTHEELTDAERELLRPIVEDDAASGAVVARRIGDVLREQGHDLSMSNECYRLAFYLSGASHQLSSNPLYSYFLAHRTGRLLDKWVHYFPIYHRHLERWRGAGPRVLEIGVYQGGGLDLWEHYFGPTAVLVGVDIDEAAIRMADPRRTIVLGDQADPEFLRSLVHNHGPFDIVIDDGGHTMEQQIVSAEVLFPLLAEGGTYLVEDTHTSYWDDHGGGLGREGTFMEWVKVRLDDLHAYHRPDVAHPVWADQVDAVHCYDSIVVLDKVRRAAPFNENQGGSDFVYLERPTSAMIGEMLAARDAALRDLDEQRGDVGEDLRIASGELAALRPRAVELESELDRIAEELTVTRNDLLEAWDQLRAMRRTLSWRVTTPLRLMRRGMGKRGASGPGAAGAIVRDLVRGHVRVEHGDLASVTGPRVALLAHWSRQPRATRSVTTLVGELQANGYAVVVTSGCESPHPLDWGHDLDLDRLVVLRKPNAGYDFGSWSVALEMVPAAVSAERTLLLNDSMAGPFASLTPLLEDFDRSPADVWGITDTQQFGSHLQSYCLGFRDGVLADRPLERFWSKVRHETDKDRIIHDNELGLSRLLRDEGYVLLPAYPHERVVAAGENPVIKGWRRLLDLGFPFVKREILRDPSVAPGGRAVRPVLHRRFGIDVADWVEDRVAA